MLVNLLKTLKDDGQVFVYESEWSEDNGLNIYIKGIFHQDLFVFLEKHSSNPVDLIHQFHSVTINEKDKYGFELVFARPLRTYVEVNRNLVGFYYEVRIFLGETRIISFMLSF